MTGRRLEFLSKASWLDKSHAVIFSRIFLANNLLALIILTASSHHMIDPTGKPLGTDFMDVWAAGKMAIAGKAAAAYDYVQHYEVQKHALPYKPGQKVFFYGWHYPPMFMLVAKALAHLSYGTALLVWMLATLPMYLLVVRAILPGRDAFVASLGFPGTFVNVGHGQNGFFTCGLLGGGLLLLEKRPVLAGILFGLLSYKPQFGLLLPLALLAGGHWRAIFAASFSVIAVAALSWALLGPETWIAFIHSLPVTKHFVLEGGFAGWPKIQSTFSAVRLLHGPQGLAYAAQGVVTVLSAAAVIWVWRQKTDMDIKGSALVTASLLATPYVMDYDLIILALPIAWLTVRGMREGFMPWEKSALLAAWLLPLFSRLIGMGLGLPTSPFALGWLLFLIARRAAPAAVLTLAGVTDPQG